MDVRFALGGCRGKGVPSHAVQVAGIDAEAIAICLGSPITAPQMTVSTVGCEVVARSNPLVAIAKCLSGCPCVCSSLYACG